jgi:hypothetical protein
MSIVARLSFLKPVSSYLQEVERLMDELIAT